MWSCRRAACRDDGVRGPRARGVVCPVSIRHREHVRTGGYSDGTGARSHVRTEKLSAPKRRGPNMECPEGVFSSFICATSSSYMLSLFERNWEKYIGYPRCHIGHLCGVDCSAAMVDLSSLRLWVARVLRAHVRRSSAWWVGNASHAFAIASSKGRERADPKP